MAPVVIAAMPFPLGNNTSGEIALGCGSRRVISIVGKVCAALRRTWSGVRQAAWIIRKICFCRAVHSTILSSWLTRRFSSVIWMRKVVCLVCRDINFSRYPPGSVERGCCGFLETFAVLDRLFLLSLINARSSRLPCRNDTPCIKESLEYAVTGSGKIVPQICRLLLTRPVRDVRRDIYACRERRIIVTVWRTWFAMIVLLHRRPVRNCCISVLDSI